MNLFQLNVLINLLKIFRDFPELRNLSINALIALNYYPKIQTFLADKLFHFLLKVVNNVIIDKGSMHDNSK